MFNIQIGIIKESELVQLFGSESQKNSYLEKGRFVGNYKTVLFKKINKYCEIKSINKRNSKENLYEITKVYEYPLPANYDKMQKSIYKYLTPLILDNLVYQHDKNNCIEITVGRWARNLYMVNRNYNLVKHNREDTSKETQIQLDIINEFYDKTDRMINWYITNTLDYLKSAGLIIWREVHQAVVEEIDDKSILDHEGNVEVNINITTHQASKDEMDFYAQCIDIADQEANIEKASERYYSHKAKLFQEVLKRELYKRKIKCIYKAYEAYYINGQKCNALLSHFDDIKKREVIDNFNKDFSNLIIENAGKYFEKSLLKQFCDTKENYQESFESLCDITINNRTEYLGCRIRDQSYDEDYNLIVKHERRKRNESK